MINYTCRQAFIRLLHPQTILQYYHTYDIDPKNIDREKLTEMGEVSRVLIGYYNTIWNNSMQQSQNKDNGMSLLETLLSDKNYNVSQTALRHAQSFFTEGIEINK